LRPRRTILTNAAGPCNRFLKQRGYRMTATVQIGFQKGIGVRKIQTKRKWGCVCRTLPDSEANQLRQEHWPVINADSYTGPIRGSGRSLRCTLGVQKASQGGARAWPRPWDRGAGDLHEIRRNRRASKGALGFRPPMALCSLETKSPRKTTATAGYCRDRARRGSEARQEGS
jgi:hypothetical protein